MKKTITRIFSAVALSIPALSTACSASEEPAPIGEIPATGTQPTATTPPVTDRNQPVNQPAQTTVILENRPTLFPTRERPHRLDLTDAMAAVSPTNTPEPTPTKAMLNTPTATPEEVAEPHMTEMMPTGPADEASGIPAAPENPQLDDSVRVQDIYQFTDLSQYALDPDALPEAGEFQYIDKERQNPGHERRFWQQQREHPYIFLIPHVQVASTPYYGSNREILGDSMPYYGSDKGILADRSPVTYFILHPWFEEAYNPQYTNSAIALGQTAFPINDFRYKNHTTEYIQRNESNYRKLSAAEGIGYRWFGDNSLKGVLLQSVANTLEQAVKPGSEKMIMPWEDTIDLNLTIEEYISVIADYPKEGLKSQFKEIYGKYRSIRYVFARPDISWEFVHPELPIIRITAEYETLLPLTTPGTDLSDQHPTTFRTSTVVAFQNRWDSFTDTNRHLIWFRPYYEFGDYYEKNAISFTINQTAKVKNKYPPWLHLTNKSTRYSTSNPVAYGLTNPEHWELFPFYWHPSDYMPHSIIGPVVTEVIESDVLEPGIYSHTPRLTQWTAPGPILTTEQLSDYYADIRIEMTTLEGKEAYGLN